MSTTIFKLPMFAIALSQRAVVSFAVLALISMVTACGGSGGGDAGDIAQDGLNTLDLANPPVQPPIQLDDVVQDDESCTAEIDIAGFLLTAPDRQWSCEVSSVVGTRFDELYFARDGTVNIASTGIWYWNRNLPADEINLASPAEPSALITDIGSSNSVLVFRTVNVTGVEEIYDCVLTGREVMTSL